MNVMMIVLSVLVTLSTVIMVTIAIHAETYMNYKRQLMEEDLKKGIIRKD